jgi:hypothetical protein
MCCNAVAIQRFHDHVRPGDTGEDTVPVATLFPGCVRLCSCPQSVSVFKMLPEVLSWNPEPFATPIPAIIVHGVCTAVLMNFSFQTLVVLGA